jgi:hypothetical protein
MFTRGDGATRSNPKYLSGVIDMSSPIPDTRAVTDQSQDEEWTVTLTNGVVSKIERVDQTTHTRKELSAEEYTGVAMSYYAMYYGGIRDYALAVASGNTELAQSYYQGMTAFFEAMGQV